MRSIAARHQLKVIPLLFALGLVWSCQSLSSNNRADSNANQANNSNAAATPTAAPQASPDSNSKEPNGENLLSLSTGAFVVKASSANHTYSDFNEFDLIDDHVGGYAGQISKKGDTSGEYVIALPEKISLDTLEFWGHDFPGNKEMAKDVEVQMSDTADDSGFQTIATVTLDNPDLVKRQTFPVSNKVPGRWLKLILKNNFGGDSVSLSEIRGYGQRLTQTPAHDISGTYGTNLYYGDGKSTKIFLKQTGTAVEGCVAAVDSSGKVTRTEQLLSNGGMANNGLLLFTQEKLIDGKVDETHPAIFVFSPDHKRIYSRITTASNSQYATIGTRISDDMGQCPQWTTKTSSLAGDLEKSNRVTLYGINFDTDSDVIRPESFATLDKIVDLAKEKPDWKFGIEGHTDSVADDVYNQKLSERRANAVKAYLVKAGVAENRLDAAGMGETKPVADNSTGIGRAQNRRVELVRK